MNVSPKHYTIIYPLIDYEMTESQCLKYCYDLGFNFGGLYAKGLKRVSCFCCPLMNNDAVRLMPKDLADRIEYYESITNPRYRTTCFDGESFKERKQRIMKKFEDEKT